MLAHTVSAVLVVAVAVGVALQLAAVSRLGIGIIRDRLARRQHSAQRVYAAAGTSRPAHRPDARHRCRDYRQALRSARPPRAE